MGNKYVFTAVLFLIFTFSCEEAMGRTCESPSSTFKGICILDRNCQAVCESEGFTDGECEGLRRRCICNKPC